MKKTTVVTIYSANNAAAILLGLILGSHRETLFLGDLPASANPATAKITPNCALHPRKCDFWQRFTDDDDYKSSAEIFSRIHRFSGKRVIVVANPENIDREFLSLTNTRQRIIHVVRDGRSVLNQAIESEEQDESTIYQYLYDSLRVTTLESLRKVSLFPDSKFLQIESVFEDPETQLAELGRYIGLKYDSNSLSYWNFAHHPLGSSDLNKIPVKQIYDDVRLELQSGISASLASIFKARNKPGITNETWRKKLSLEDRFAYDYVIGDLHGKLGYKRDRFTVDELNRCLDSWGLRFGQIPPERPPRKPIARTPYREYHTAAAPGMKPLTNPGPGKYRLLPVINRLSPSQSPGPGSKITTLYDLEAPSATVGLTTTNSDGLVRVLPYPFNSYFSIDNDCDIGDIASAIETGTTIRHTYGLSVSNSLFIDELFRVYGLDDEQQVVGVDFDNISTDQFFDRNFDYLRLFYEGWFDVIHGWFSYNFVRLVSTAEFFYLSEQRWMDAGRAAPWNLGGKTSEPVKIRFSMAEPEGWLQGSASKYLYFEYSMPIRRSGLLQRPDCRFQIKGFDSDKLAFSIDSNNIDSGYSLTPKSILVQIGEGEIPNLMPRIDKVTIELMDTVEESLLQIKNMAFLYFSPQLVVDQACVLKSFNLGISVFSSHGIGIVLGCRSMASRNALSPLLHSDNSQSPLYLIDELRQFGLEFFNTFQNTFSNRVRHIEEVTKISQLNDSSLVYDYDRYACLDSNEQRLEKDGSQIPGIWKEFTDFHVRQLLAESNSRGQGGLVYTHLAASMAKDGQASSAPDRAKIGSELHSELDDLSNRHFNLDGKIAAENRIWVSSTSTLLKYSVALKSIGEHASYCPISNSIQITSWFDPVLQKYLPDPAKNGSDMRWLTFYVENADSARCFIDNTEYHSLIRNHSPDEIADSVAIADVSWPTIIFDQVPLEEKGTVDVKSGSLSHLNAHGDTRLRVTPDNEIQCCTFLYRPDVKITAINQHILRIGIRTDISILGNEDKPLMEFMIRFKDQTEWHLDTEYFFKSGAFRFAKDDRGWSQVIIPIWWLIEHSANSLRKPPNSEIAEIALNTNVAVEIERLEFCRDNERPERGNNQRIVGGRISDGLNIDEISMKLANKSYVTKPTHGGHYFFSACIADGEIIELSAIDNLGNNLIPVTGSRHEIYRDTLGHHFV